MHQARHNRGQLAQFPALDVPALDVEHTTCCSCHRLWRVYVNSYLYRFEPLYIEHSVVMIGSVGSLCEQHTILARRVEARESLLCWWRVRWCCAVGTGYMPSLSVI